MYKLFLTIRYLTRKAIVIFPILVVWLCVAMLVIVTSIMGGFVDRVKQINRDITGDIIVEGTSMAGFPYYGEMKKEIEKLPEVELATPMIQAFGLISARAGGRKVQVYGIVPEEHARVTRWRDSLYYQNIAPLDAVEDLSSAKFPATTKNLQDKADELCRAQDAKKADLDAENNKIKAGERVKGRGFNIAWLFLLIPVMLADWLLIALTRDGPRQWRWVWWLFPTVMALVLVALAVVPMMPHKGGPGDKKYMDDDYQQWNVADARARMTRGLTWTLPAGATYATPAALRDALWTDRPPSFEMTAGAAAQLSPKERAETTKRGAVIGVDLVAERDQRGKYNRNSNAYDLFTGRLDVNVLLTVAPMAPNRTRGSNVMNSINAQSENVQLIDDSYTGFAEADGSCIYADFDLVQRLALMQAQAIVDPDTGVPTGETAPARATMLEVKLKGAASPQQMTEARDKIAKIVDAIYVKHKSDFYFTDMKVSTWDIRQEKYISAVQNEKNMITFILGLMSMVVLVVVFLIFYIIVRDKTRDIGIIKAVGGSEWGVANIFTVYGGMIGLIGGLAGAATGMAFVRHTNEIHEWLFTTFGIVIWKRDVYLFDRIPDQYNIWEVALYFGIAVAAGILGAMIPALVAGFANPVRALRHE